MLKIFWNYIMTGNESHYESTVCVCANGNPARRNHCEDTREPGAAEPRLGVFKTILEVLMKLEKETRSTMSRVGKTHKGMTLTLRR